MPVRTTSRRNESPFSPPLNKHQQRTEATRRKLLTAARRIFARDGFEAARIDDIAAEAGHTRGAFYAHFKTKEDLFFALLEEQAARHLNNIRELMESSPTDAQRLKLLRTSYLSRASDKQWTILVLEFKLYALRHGKLRAKLAEAHRNIRTKMKLETIASILPKQLQSGTEFYEFARAALEGMLSGVLLERAYDPTSISEKQVLFILEKIFDLVVGLSSEQLP